MHLFPIEANPELNLLPKDGSVFYFGSIFSDEEAAQIFTSLQTSIFWKADELVLFGKRIITKRKVAWYAEHAMQYTYSGITKTALPFTPLILELKTKIEKLSADTFNSCLLNFYHSGAEGMGYHSDDEADLKEDACIASLSFGAKRKFVFKHKYSNEKVEILLENGSLLLMKDQTQRFWKHRLPEALKVKEPRINLTFRTIVEK